MKLTTEQIEYVENYNILILNGMNCSRTDDHMVTSMEGFGKKS
jgi:hypothetical protein